MAMTIINNAEFKGIVAKFAKGSKTKIQNGNHSHLNEETCIENCAFCGAKDSQLVCGGCSNFITGTFYCSEDHQAKDWIRHKSECKSMPMLRNVQELTRVNSNESSKDLIEDEEPSLLRGKFIIKSIEKQLNVGEKVFITKVRSPRVIYVRPVSEDEGYEMLLETIKKASIKSSKIVDKPKINGYILAPYRQSFHRAKVLDFFEPDEKDCNTKVFLVDFGDEIKVKWQECKMLGYQMRGMNTFIFKFVLDGIEIAHEHREIMHYLNEIYQNNEALMISGVRSNRKILKRINGEIVNDEINQIALATSTISSVNASEPVLYNVSFKIDDYKI